jgi:hypothetical protein
VFLKRERKVSTSNIILPTTIKPVILDPWQGLLLAARRRDTEWDGRAGPTYDTIDEPYKECEEGEIRYDDTEKHTHVERPYPHQRDQDKDCDYKTGNHDAYDEIHILYLVN